MFAHCEILICRRWYLTEIGHREWKIQQSNMTQYSQGILRDQQVRINVIKIVTIRCDHRIRVALTHLLHQIYWTCHVVRQSRAVVIIIHLYIAIVDLHCQCILSIFPASLHQVYKNILVFININPFLYTNNQFALDTT